MQHTLSIKNANKRYQDITAELCSLS